MLSNHPPVEFFIEGAPVAQGRPRATGASGYIKLYDPKKSKSWKEYVLTVARINFSRRKKRDKPLLEGPLIMTLTFYMPRPKSLPKKVVHHIKTPDVDNLVKGVKDALSGYCYKDDKQIVELRAKKVYAEKGSPGGVSVKIKEILVWSTTKS